ncbi:DUF6090 family protein [Litoribaculum gwangyangense]|uniref:Uncharacterized protein n=1 Tax=Litoribaculum gwangyangense TaxID=1130722 RepID=A0ABP9CEI9_9FLAO
MIKLFRNIRKTLINEGKTYNYIKYAIGEIILVMIGILLALQINNWNENRKDTLKEVANLKSLKSELEISLEELKSDYKATELYHNSALKVQNYIRNIPQISDSMHLDFYLSFQISNFYPKTSTYETFKNGNLELIKSDSLKILITDIYEAGYKRILSRYNTTRISSRMNYYQEHFRITSNAKPNEGLLQLRRSFKAIPNNYEFLMNDPKFESIISETIYVGSLLLRDFENTIEVVKKGISEIEDYLKTK